MVLLKEVQTHVEKWTTPSDPSEGKDVKIPVISLAQEFLYEPGLFLGPYLL
jgi:hypothetical protein